MTAKQRHSATSKLINIMISFGKVSGLLTSSPINTNPQDNGYKISYDFESRLPKNYALNIQKGGPGHR